MLPCRRSHTVLFPRTFLRSLALAQCPRFQWTRHCRLLHSVVQLDAATQLDLTEFLIGWIFSDGPLDRRHPLCQSPAISAGLTYGTSAPHLDLNSQLLPP